jgi:hypothetical protein
MATLVNCPGFIFGEVSPQPIIEGYEVVMQPNEFLRAFKDGREFIVQDGKDHWTLSPRQDWNGKVAWNFEQAINVPK